MTNVRSSLARRGNCSGVSVRRSRGQFTLSRRGVGRGEGLMGGFSKALDSTGDVESRSARTARAARRVHVGRQGLREERGTRGREMNWILEMHIPERLARERIEEKGDPFVSELSRARVVAREPREVARRREAGRPPFEPRAIRGLLPSTEARRLGHKKRPGATPAHAPMTSLTNDGGMDDYKNQR